MLKKLLKTYQLRQTLEKNIVSKKQAFSDSIALDVAQLNDLIEKESLLREQTFLLLEARDLDSIKQDDHIIIRQVKKTKQIVDALKLKSSIIYNALTLKHLGINLEELDLFKDTVLIKDKNTVNEIIDKWEKVEGKLFDGIEIKETKFIVIK